MKNKKILVVALLIAVIVIISFLLIFKKENNAKVYVYNETIPSNFVLAENSISKVKYPSDWSWTMYKDAERIKFHNPEHSIIFSIHNSFSSFGPNTSLEQRKKNQISALQNIDEAAAENKSPDVTYDKDIKIISTLDIEVNGVRGYQILYSAISGTNNEPYKALFIELEKNNNFYEVFVVIDADKYDSLIGTVRQIISSIEIN